MQMDQVFQCAVEWQGQQELQNLVGRNALQMMVNSLDAAMFEVEN